MDKTVKEEKKIEKQVGGLINEGRVMSFSDAVFAFAATLLVLKIDLPVVIQDQLSTNLSSAFSALLPQYIANVISFLVIGYYWVNHHAIFAMVKRYNATLVWLNIIFLIFLSFIPFPVDLYGDYPTVPNVVAIYSGSLAIVGYILAGLWWYATRKHLLGDNIDSNRANYYFTRNLVAPIIFTVAIPIVYIDPILAQFSWLFVLVGVFLVGRIFHQTRLSNIDKASL